MQILDDPFNWAPIITATATLVAAFTGAFVGQWLARYFEGKRSRRRDFALLGALIAEVEHCAAAAGTYCDERIHAPAYRLHHKVYDSALSVLAGSVLSGEDVAALISFYSQVDQVNWGLDEVDRLDKRVREQNSYTSATDQLRSQELSRLNAKATEMRSPMSRFYTPAIDALRAQQEKLKDRE
jgi:hypothetical protein